MINARACKFQMKEKLMFIPRGRAVPSLEISRISSLFRWMLLPVHSLRAPFFSDWVRSGTSVENQGSSYFVLKDNLWYAT